MKRKLSTESSQKQVDQRWTEIHTLDFVLFLNAETSPLKEHPFLLFRVNFQLARVRVQRGQKSFNNAKIYCCTLCSGAYLETLVQIDFWSAKLLTTHDVKSNIERFQIHSSFNLLYSPISLTKSLHFHSSLRFARDGILKTNPFRSCVSHFYASLL